MASGTRNDHLDRLHGEVSEVTSLLKDNVDKVITRGDKLDEIQQKAEDLESSSIQFHRKSKALHRKMCCQNLKMTCILILVIAVIITGIVLIILFTVKPWDSSSSSHKEPHGNHTNSGIQWY